MEPLAAPLCRLDADLLAIVEQGMYPCPDVPFPVSTCNCFAWLDLGPTR